MIDPVSSAYFDRRERELKRVGLDPDDDDDWAIPDYDLGHQLDDPDFYFDFDVLEVYDSKARRWCVRCLDDVAEPNSRLCLMCDAEYDRQYGGKR